VRFRRIGFTASPSSACRRSRATSLREVACGAATTNSRHCAGGPFPLLTTVTTRALALAHKYSRVPVAFRGRWLIQEQGGGTPPARPWVNASARTTTV
jgi:hypothetical protein